MVNSFSLIPLVGGYLQNAVTIISQLSVNVDNLNIKVELKKLNNISIVSVAISEV